MVRIMEPRLPKAHTPKCLRVHPPGHNIIWLGVIPPSPPSLPPSPSCPRSLSSALALNKLARRVDDVDFVEKIRNDLLTLPDAITRLFKEAYNTFLPLEGKPTDDDLLAIQECILPLLMVIPYDQLNGIHSLTAILTDAAKYESEHDNKTFVRPVHLPLYDKNNADDATTVVRVRAEAAHKSCLDDYASNEAAERGVAKFLRNVVDEIKDTETFYTKVTAIEIMALLDANSGGLHAVDMISLRTNMTQYYVQADGIPQFIIMMEDAQKKPYGRACPSPTSNS